MLVNNGGGLPQGDTDNRSLSLSHAGDPCRRVPGGLEGRARWHRDQPIALDGRAQGFRYGSDPYLVQIRRSVGSTIDTMRCGSVGVAARSDDVAAAIACRVCRIVELDAIVALFDTEIAARLVGLERFGLAAVAEQVLGAGLVKDKWAFSWSVRPLPKGGFAAARRRLCSRSCITACRSAESNGVGATGVRRTHSASAKA